MPASTRRCLISLECVKAWGITCDRHSDCFCILPHLTFVLCALTALVDDFLKLVAISESVPHRTAQELPSVLSNKGEFTTKCAGASCCGELL